MVGKSADQTRYETAESERQRHIDAILQSKSKKKIVVAGPGTGKTFLFKSIVASKNSALTLTFVNSLVEELSLELYGLSEVRTLHGFARSLIARALGSVKVFPKLSEIIREDGRLLLKQDINFEEMLYEMNKKHPEWDFYFKRRSYYGYFGHSDLIFNAVQQLAADEQNVPVYDQIIVDEFQDFNQLEVSLIDLLANKSPILITGDDDQALYDFKRATADFIRTRHGDDSTEFESFVLPYCSRSTRVIIDAVNDIIGQAKKEGHLQKRVSKPYGYFDCREKDEESARYPMISYFQLYAKQIPWLITKCVDEIAMEEKTAFSILVICPTTTQCRTTSKALERKGFQNVQGIESSISKMPTLADGLKLLMKDAGSNVGWRVVLRSLLKEPEFIGLLEKTHQNSGQDFAKLADKETGVRITELVSTLKMIFAAEKVPDDRYERLYDALGIIPQELVGEKLRDEMQAEAAEAVDAGIRRVPIRVTTIPGSKGLAADYVFFAYCDDRYLIKDADKPKVVDRDICNFIVALTRARKKVFLLSSQKAEPIFFKWIAKSRCETKILGK